MTSSRIERLCEHHKVNDFSCGPDSSLDYAFMLRDHASAFARGDLPRPRDPQKPIVFVIADEADLRVLAYMTLGELEVSPQHGGARKLYVVVPELAVDGRYQAGNPVVRFLRVVERWRAEHDPEKVVYAGLACVPHTNPKVERVLSRLGFQPGPDRDAFFWWKPFDD